MYLYTYRSLHQHTSFALYNSNLFSRRSGLGYPKSENSYIQRTKIGTITVKVPSLRLKQLPAQEKEYLRLAMSLVTSCDPFSKRDCQVNPWLCWCWMCMWMVATGETAACQRCEICDTQRNHGRPWGTWENYRETVQKLWNTWETMRNHRFQNGNPWVLLISMDSMGCKTNEPDGVSPNMAGNP